MAENISKTFEIKVISPSGGSKVGSYKYHDDVNMVILRCLTGDMGILPGRAPVSAVLDAGVMRVIKDGTERKMAVLGGVASMNHGILTILADTALWAEDIDEEDVEEEKKKAENLFKEAKDRDEKEYNKTLIKKASVKLAVVSKK